MTDSPSKYSRSSPSPGTKVAGPLSRARTVMYVAERYGWDPNRVDRAILRLADAFGRTNEVYYPDPQNYRRVTVVWLTRLTKDRYEIREEKRPARLAAVPGVRYTSVVPVSKAASSPEPLRQEANTMQARTRKSKPAPAPEPEEIEDEVLEEEEEDEELEDSEDVEEDEELEDAGDVEEDEADEEEEEADEDEEEKDYTPYAGKAPTPTMTDFGDWLLAEVYGDDLPEDFDEQSFREGVRLGGTLRMEFQRSDFCRERREERKAAAAAAKAAPKTPAKTARKAKEPEPEPEPTPVRKTKTAAKATAPVVKSTAARKPGSAPGKPAGRAADRASAAKKTPIRPRTRQTEEPF